MPLNAGQQGRKARYSANGFGIAGALLMSTTVMGQGVIEEVIVTAQKRSENVQEVPVAISAFSAERLEETGFDSFGDLENIVPGLQLGNFGPVTFVNLRGIGNENTTAGGDPGVALHFDGVYIGRPVGFLFSAFDSERVEVLRGPQGTLYGRNATGGSINYITKKPTDELEGEADLTVGNYSMIRGRAALNVPLSDKVKTRFVGFFEDRDGFTENLNPNGRDPNDAKNWGIRGHVAFDLSDRGDLLLSGTYVKSGGVGSKPELREPYPAQALAGPPGFAFSGGPGSGVPANNIYIGPDGFIPVNDLRPFREATDADLKTDLEFILLSATLNYDLGPVSLKSITAYAEMDYLSVQDQDHSILPLSELLITESSQQFSQEIQLVSNSTGPLRWIIGAYYFEEKADRRSQFFQGRFDTFAQVFNQPAGWDIDGDVKTTSYAFFGQATYDVTEALAVTAGIRYSNDEKKGENRGFIFAGAPYAAPVGDSWDELTYRFVADYKVTEDILAYASYSTGYRSGGINQAVNPIVNAIYDPETVDAFEIGVKTNLFDRRAQLNISAYRNEYKDLQFQVFGAVGPEAFNASGATVQGIETELLAYVTESLVVNMAASYTDSAFDPQVIDGVQLDDNQVQRTPEWTFNIGATQQIDLGDRGMLKIRGEFAFTDKMFYSAFNRNGGFDSPGGSDLAPSYENVNIRVFWFSPDEAWTIELAATNVFDTAQVGNLFRGIGFNDIPGGGGLENVTYNPPRQVMARVARKF